MKPLQALSVSLVLAATGCAVAAEWPNSRAALAGEAERRAIAFLSREVPLWARENGCFSCHNNGDGARALYTAMARSYRVPGSALVDTTAWLARPERWDDNKGDPAFSDKVLARMQFAAALAAARGVRQVRGQSAFLEATRLITEVQESDGSWPVKPEGALGSPATWGTHLATAMTRLTLGKLAPRRHRESIARADAWLRGASVNNVLQAGAVLFALARREDPEAVLQRERCLEVIGKGQARNGGWGPWTNSPPEPFDTAVVVLALSELVPAPEIRFRLERGREYLLDTQLPDGSWPETTRPPEGTSYAQRLSTTGWATLALLATSGRTP